MLSIQIAVAKTHKYASRESGDTAETVERPTGGLSVLLVDGQGSGAAAKSLSMMVSSKVVASLKDGTRDGVVARGAHDFLHAFRHGRVSATLDIVSIDLATSTVVVTRNSPVPYLVKCDGVVRVIESSSSPIGLYRHTRPSIDQYAIAPGLRVVILSDGVSSAGQHGGTPFDPLCWFAGGSAEGASAGEIADGLLAKAIRADSGRPRDDMTVVAVTIDPGSELEPVRRMAVSLPYPG